MTYLLLAILFSSSINIGFTLAKAKNMNNLNVTLFNYVTAAVLAAGMCVSAQVFANPFVLADTFGVFQGTVTMGGSMSLSVVLGCITGCIYLNTLTLVQKSIKVNGPSPTTMFSSIGIVFPILLSIFIWDERPGAIQWVGIIVALLALLVYNYDGGKLKINTLLLVVFVAKGFSETANKVYSTYGYQELKPLYLLALYATALLLCLGLRGLGKEKSKVRPAEVALGAGIGFSNIFGAFFAIKALTTLPASIVFPVQAGGVILLIVVVSMIFFQERLNKIGWIAVGMTVISIVLVNL